MSVASGSRLSAYEANVWKFYAMRAIVGIRFIAPINLLYYQSFGLTYGQIGLVESTAAIAVLALEIPTGVFADLLGRKRSYLIAYVLSVIAFAVMSTGSGLAAFMVGWAISGAADAFQSGADDAILYDSLKKIGQTDRFVEIKGRLILIGAASLIVGSVAGGYLYLIDRRLPWLLFTGCIAVSGVFCALLEEPPLEVGERTTAPRIHELRESLVAAFSSSTVRWLIIFCVVLTVPTYAFSTLLSQPYLVDHGFGVASLGFIFAVIGGCSGLLGSMSHRVERKLGEKASFLVMTYLFVSLFVLAGLVQGRGALVLVVALFALANYRGVVISNYVNHRIESTSRATVLSVQSFVSNVTISALMVLTGHLVDRYSMNAVLVGLGGCLLLFSLPFLAWRYWLAPERP